jgi:hypothetical protein
LLGAVLVSLQSILFIGCLAVYGGATLANITYSARGLISVLLIWLVGHHFGNTEGTQNSRILVYRFLGAACMLVAILLAQLSRH